MNNDIVPSFEAELYT